MSGEYNDGQGGGRPEGTDPVDNDYRLQNNSEAQGNVSSNRNGAEGPRPSALRRGPLRQEETFQDEESEGDDEGFDMSLGELLYSTSSFYAIVVPVTITMILSALAVVYINTEETIEEGAEQMADAYQVWKTSYDGSDSVGRTIALSLANSFVMVSVICVMTFVIVLLYRYECMKCLIGYMMLCSTTLLGLLGGHMYWIAIQIYRLPVDKLSYYLGLWNFAVVGVLAIFWGKGVPRFISQGYLIATSVILAWHLDYFDEYTTWTLLFMLALYDLCAVLSPCGPLKALVSLMSRDNAPEMPGLLYEADLPPEARKPGSSRNKNSSRPGGYDSTENTSQQPEGEEASGVWDNRSSDSGPTVEIPLAVARVYNLPVSGIPRRSQGSFSSSSSRRQSSAPLLRDEDEMIPIPENPNPAQLMADVQVQLPRNGGRIEKVRRNGRVLYLERDRYSNPKRVLWVDRQGRVFAESSDGDDFEDRNTIKLGLGDFIFYSVLVAKAAQYSFTTFAACMLVILAGLGGTLVLLSVFHQALPALPISICLGIFFYIFTRVFMEPWIQAILLKPYYV